MGNKLVNLGSLSSGDVFLFGWGAFTVKHPHPTHKEMVRCAVSDDNHSVYMARGAKVLRIAHVGYVSVVLGMLDNPVMATAVKILSEVYGYNDYTDLEDLDFFKECASLVISEKGL